MICEGLVASPACGSLALPQRCWRGGGVWPLGKSHRRRLLDGGVAAGIGWRAWRGDDAILRKALAETGAEIPALAEGAHPPHFVLAWLGMGEDGHIASLFPNTDPQPDEPQPILRLTPDPLPPEAPFDRITLTLPVLAEADALMFVIRGQDKRAVFDAAARGETDKPVARLLKATHAHVTCFC